MLPASVGKTDGHFRLAYSGLAMRIDLALKDHGQQSGAERKSLFPSALV